MNNPLEYKKGPMGHMLDMRRAMGEAAEVMRQWCHAFDAGDNQAVEDLGNEFTRCMRDVGKAADAANSFEA